MKNTMKKSKILLVDDSASFLNLFLHQAGAADFDMVTFTSAEKALAYLDTNSVEVILSDVEMPNMSGMEFFECVQDRFPEIPFIFITNFATTEKAVDAIQRGAYHYFEKPLEKKMDLFWSTIRQAVDKYQRAREIESLRKEKSLHTGMPVSLIGQSAIMRSISRSIRKVAETSASVLIHGKTGTGKEVVARAIHENGNRRDKGFFPVDCSSYAPGVLESELFGHEKGAFTGAVQRKKGVFETADGGTLFLDEISNASLEVQAKLLRVLDTKGFSRVGGTSVLFSDFRLIAASNIPLKAEVAAGRFREDLFYRLNIYPIDLPPLRKRKEDLPQLIHYYFNWFNQIHRRALEGISEKAILAMGEHDWPGNVRELANVVERAVVNCEGKIITEKDLALLADRAPGLSGFNLKAMERFLISMALEKSNFNKTHAAKLLGISRKTLIEKVKKYKIQDVK